MDLLRYAIQDCIPSHGAWLKISSEIDPIVALCKKSTLANLEKAGMLVLLEELRNL